MGFVYKHSTVTMVTDFVYLSGGRTHGPMAIKVTQELLCDVTTSVAESGDANFHEYL